VTESEAGSTWAGWPQAAVPPVDSDGLVTVYEPGDTVLTVDVLGELGAFEVRSDGSLAPIGVSVAKARLTSEA
jgi:hypothetical protein